MHLFCLFFTCGQHPQHTPGYGLIWSSLMTDLHSHEGLESFFSPASLSDSGLSNCVVSGIQLLEEKRKSGSKHHVCAWIWHNYLLGINEIWQSVTTQVVLQVEQLIFKGPQIYSDEDIMTRPGCGNCIPPHRGPLTRTTVITSIPSSTKAPHQKKKV